jgi:hypothetical protein
VLTDKLGLWNSRRRFYLRKGERPFAPTRTLPAR